MSQYQGLTPECDMDHCHKIATQTQCLPECLMMLIL